MISFVVPAYNEAQLLGRCLDALQAAGQTLGELFGLGPCGLQSQVVRAFNGDACHVCSSCGIESLHSTSPAAGGHPVQHPPRQSHGAGLEWRAIFIR